MLNVVAHNGHIQSVERALAILERTAAAPDGLALRDLAVALGLRASTVHNLAATLLARGYLLKTATPKRYTLGPAAHALTGDPRQPLDLCALEGALRQLAVRWSDVTLTIAQPHGHEVMTSLRISPERRGVLQHPTHLMMPPYTSSSALVFEAFWTADERAAYQRHYPFAEYGKGYWGQSRRHDQFLARVRRAGCATLDLGDGRLRVAVPVFDSAQVIRAALGGAWPTPAPANVARLVRALQQAAAPLAETGTN